MIPAGGPRILLIQLYGQMQPPDAEPLSIDIVASAILEHSPTAQIEIQTLSVREGAGGVQRISHLVSEQAPIVVGISVPQSTFDLAVGLIDAIYQVVGTEPHIVLGHALPTHSPDLFLQIFPKAIIVRGYGEDSFVQIVEHFITRAAELSDIPNLCYLRDGELHLTPIRWPSKIRKPLRSSPGRYFPRVEASRGCQHDICTFCTRPPHDDSHSTAWYRRPTDEVLKDIADIKANVKRFFTFADEDFIGPDLEGAREIADGLAKIGGMQFSLSVRADNVFNPYGTYAENERRRRLFESLRKAGLYLVFIGVESLSDTQLKRYGKGVTADDSVQAVREIQRLGVGLEMGFILFDPLLTKAELIENVQRLDQSGLWANVGQLFNCIRAQKDSYYLRLLVMSELMGQYDPNSMSYDYSFADQTVGEIARFCRSWLEEFDPIYLLARNIERTSESEGAYAHFVLGTRSLLFRLLRTIVHIRITQGQHMDQQTLTPFQAEREGLVRSLHRYLVSRSVLTETEAALKQECEFFIAREMRTQ